MPYCPICGSETGEQAPECPTCHLDVALFTPVRDAALLSRDSDPVYYRTIAELLRSVDLFGPAPEIAEPTPVARPSPAAPPAASAPSLAPARSAGGPAGVALLSMPSVPELPTGAALRSRAHEYEVLGRSLSADLSAPAARVAAALDTDDEPALSEAVREMYLRLSSALVVAYDHAGARRAELAARVPTSSLDTQLSSVRTAMEAADLTGAARHLARATEELAHLEEGWATQRILRAECDLLVETIRELGGDPAPAIGPLEEARRQAEANQPEQSELLLAQTTYALWVVLEPRFTEELKRLRDRLVELRHAGADVGPPLAQLRSVAVEIRRRNFGGTITAYRQLREMVGRAPEPPPLEPSAPAERATPPA